MNARIGLQIVSVMVGSTGVAVANQVDGRITVAILLIVAAAGLWRDARRL